MLKERSLKLDLLALALLAASVFLAASLLSYHPGDPPSKLVSPKQTETLNVCGQWGALASRALFGAFGLGAYYLLFSLAALDVVLLSRCGVSQPVLRAAGWLISLVGVTTLAAMAAPGFSPGPVIGSGGYLGAAGRGLLEMHFAAFGAYVLTVSMILGGLLLCTDYLLIQIFAWTVGKPTMHLGRGMMQVSAAYAQKVGEKRSKAAIVEDTPAEDDEEEDEDEDEEEEEAIEEVAVRIAGRPGEKEEEDEDELEDDGEPEADETEEEDEPKPRTKIRSMFGLGGRGKSKTEHQKIIAELDAADSDDDAGDYELPGIDLLLESEAFCFEDHEKEVLRRAKLLEKTFANFGFKVCVKEIQTGPVIAQYEVELEAGLRLSKISGLADDLAIALRVPSVRVVAPIPGKNTVGIEVPNTERQLVRLREVMEESNGKTAKMRIPIYLGKDVAGNPMVVDLTSLPHLLIAGRTGTGKSVCLNSIIVSMLMTRRPDEVRMLMVDPKMVELSPYKRLPHLMHPVVTDMQKAEAILAWAVDKMEERYTLLARAGVRHISSYNQLGEEELMERIQPADDEERQQIPTHIPYIVIVADEIADLMMTAAKEVESHIIRLAQKSRAVGIHLVLATQKPTVDVITGLIKSNLPARIAFQVASRTDSRVVLDEMGADRLLGNGDMLFLWPGTSTLIRGQGTFLCDDEITKVINSVATTEPQFVTELVQLPAAGAGPDDKQAFSSRDELYEAAIDVVVREGRGSVSLLQRALGIGYGRAARLIDYMAEDGIVGPYNGSQARDILITFEQWQEMNGEAPEPKPEPKRPRHSNKILLAPAGKPDVIDVEFEEEKAARHVPAPNFGNAPETSEEDDDGYEEPDDEEPTDEEYDYREEELEDDGEGMYDEDEQQECDEDGDEEAYDEDEEYEEEDGEEEDGCEYEEEDYEEEEDEYEEEDYEEDDYEGEDEYEEDEYEEEEDEWVESA